MKLKPNGGLQVSVSELKTWLTCNRKFLYGEYHAKSKHAPPGAMDLGGIFHKAAEEIALKKRLPDILAVEAVDKWKKLFDDYELDPKLEATLNDGIIYLRKAVPGLRDFWEVNPPGEVLQLEQAASLELGDHTIVGRPDAIIKRQNELWHRQIKTAAASTSITLTESKYALDWHEAVYIYMAEMHHKKAVAGTELLLCRKTKVPSFFQSFILRDERELGETINTVRLTCDKIAVRLTADEREERFPMNPTACTTWNRTCMFLPVCRKLHDLSEGDFITKEDRYGDVCKGKS